MCILVWVINNGVELIERVDSKKQDFIVNDFDIEH
jgi:hypothetical protein